MVVIGIRMLLMSFEWLELAFESFDSRSKVLNWHSNASNPVRMVAIGIRMLLFPFELWELAFECFESRSNGWNWHSNASNQV